MLTLEADSVLGLPIEPGEDSIADSETSDDSFVVGVGGSRAEPGNRSEFVAVLLAAVVTGGAGSESGARELDDGGGRVSCDDDAPPRSLSLPRLEEI